MISVQGKEVKFIKFSDGDLRVEIPDIGVWNDTPIIVSLSIEDIATDIYELQLVNEAISRNFPGVEKQLYTPYIPSARADRVFNSDVAFSLKVVADIINSCGFSHVMVEDPHSDVAPALIDNVKVLFTQAQLVHRLFGPAKLSAYTLCAPDLGAAKKIDELRKLEKKQDYIQVIKLRDVETGDIVKCDIVQGDPQGKNVLIVDDIADGAGSFIHLAEMLKERGAASVDLYVTHGIFSKGLDILKGKVDHLYIENVIGHYITRDAVSKFNKGE